MIIDISHHHPVTNWTKVKNNVDFLITKASEGTSYIDSTLSSVISNCEKLNIPYWLYTYLKKGNELNQCKFLVSTCESKIGKHFMGYILDVEENNTASNIAKCIEYISNLGFKCGIYTGYSNYNVYKTVLNNRPDNMFWWESRYGKNDGTYNSKYPCHTGVDLHQFTSNGSLSGVSGNIDLNRLTGTKKLEWFTGNSTTIIKTELSVDGLWGCDTTSAFQSFLKCKIIDGTVSNQLDSYKNNNPGLLSESWKWDGNGIRYSPFILELQKYLNKTIKAGLKCDGLFGAKTCKALQKWLKCDVIDGCISYPSPCVKKLQTYLNIH